MKRLALSLVLALAMIGGAAALSTIIETAAFAEPCTGC